MATSVIFDIAFHATENVRWPDIVYVMIGCGALGGLLAAVFTGWLSLRSRERVSS